jgi:hypothetical protein
MANTIVPVGTDVKGDITNCKIETIKKSVDRKGSLSFTQKEHFVTYDVCTKQVVTEYQTSTITGGGFTMILLIVVVSVIVFLSLMSRFNDW